MTLTRNSTRVAVGAAVALMLVLGLVGGIAPAFAGHGAGTANVNVHEILAGTQDQPFSITVTHPAGPGAPAIPDPLNPPQAPAPLNTVLVTSPPGFAIDSAAGPNESGSPAWDVTILKLGSTNRQALFTLKSGKNGIAAGGSGAFSIQADVPVPSKELATSWEVQTSSDGGGSNQFPSGDLSTNVRILKIQNVAITAPAGATDGTVSGLQGEARDVDGDSINDEPAVMTRCEVSNHSSATHLVTPTLSGGPNVTIVSAPAAANVAAGDTRAFDFQLKFADVSSTVGTALQCNATSTGGGGTGSTPTGFNAQTPVTIQPRAKFSYVANTSLPSFSPSALSPNKVVTFKVAVQKTGTPAVALDPAKTRLGFLNKSGPGFAIPKQNLSSSPAVPANNATNFFLEFGPVNIGALADGRYQGELDMRGTDANDSAVGFVPLTSFAEKLLIDAGIPVLTLNVTPPALPANWPATADHDYVARAVRNGQTLTFGGNVTDADPDTGVQGACGTCTIVPGTAALRQFDGEAGGAISGSDIPVNLSINATTGNITGTYNGSGYASATKSVMLVAQVVDTAGNPSALTLSSGCGYCPARFSDAEKALLSGRAVVDSMKPTIVEVRSRRDTDGSQDLLEVTLSECVSGTTNSSDWSFPGGSPLQRVTATRPATGIPSCSVSSPVPLVSKGTITLELAEPLPDDDTAGAPLGQIRYAPGANVSVGGAGTRFGDRTASTVDDVTKTILDGIAPLAPVIQNIQLGTRVIGLQDGAFWTNIDTPKFLLTDQAGQPQRSVANGNTARLFQETNGIDGLQAGDTQISKDADSVAQGCPADDGNPSTPLPPCTILVEADFSVPGASNADTSQSTAAHKIYAVMLDQATPKNASVATSALVEIDRIKPNVDIVGTQFQASQIQVKFTDSIAFGNNRANDWLIVDDDDRFVGLSSVANSTSADSRLLTVGSSHYNKDKVMQFGYRFLGPAAQRYEDRATNSLNDSATCLKLVAGSDICPA